MKRINNTTYTGLFAATALAASLGFAGSAMAATLTVDSLVETGTIFETTDNTTEFASIDYWQFEVAVAGVVSIDVLSRRELGGDGTETPTGTFTGGPYSLLDSELILFNFDAAGDLGMMGSLIVENDDGNNDGFTDGSSSGLDSFLSEILVVGSYVVAISDFGFDEVEARAGLNDTPLQGTFADYQLTFTGIDVDVPAAVPLPASLPMLLAGIGLLGFARRRRARTTA